MIVQPAALIWTTVREFEDIRYETAELGSIAKITINRPEVRNAFPPKTVAEMLTAFDLAGNATLLYYMSEVGKEGKQAFIEKRKPDFSKFPRAL